MKSKAAKIPRSQYPGIRRVAREAYAECGGDIDQAESLVSDRIGKVVGSVWVAIAIQIAMALIKHWMKNGIDKPTVIAAADEPYSELFQAESTS